jgi:hypothetical protein
MAKYNDEMPSNLIKYMRQGHSFEASCGFLGVSRQAGYDWAKKYDEFKEAKRLGETYSLRYMEQLALACATGVMPDVLKESGSKKLNTTMIIFILKTRFHKIYGEKLKLQNSDDAGVEVTLNYAKNTKKRIGKNKK